MSLVVSHHIHLVLQLVLVDTCSGVTEGSNWPWSLNEILLPLVVHVRIDNYLLHWICDSTKNLLFRRETWRNTQRIFRFVRLVLLPNRLRLWTITSGLCLRLLASQRVLLVRFPPRHHLIILALSR